MSEVPVGLRRWFVLHFAIDIVVAAPIFFAPQAVLATVGWVSVDPLAARLSAAALFAIGLESLFGRNAGRQAFIGMLQLKLVWSGFAAIGIGWSTLEGSLSQPWVGWALAGVFAAFHGLWWYWLVKLKSAADKDTARVELS